MAPRPEIHPKARAIVFTIVAGFLLLIVTGLSLIVEEKSQTADYWVAHSFEVRSLLDRSLVLLLDAETTERGYLLTDDVSYLRSDASFSDLFALMTARLEAMVADHPSQQARARVLHERGVQRLRLIDAVIDDRRSEAVDSYGAGLRVRMERGKALTNDVRSLIGDMKAEEDRLLTDRRARKLRFDRSATAVILSASGILIAMGVGLVRIQRDLDRREKLEARLVQEKRDRERLIRDLERS
ncbi:MAG TPA: CHASE3 domain-containing protein, partial [Polyangia bacterium]|nr:CHASE3 domain-containing protein [Polyangia bacterium]